MKKNIWVVQFQSYHTKLLWKWAYVREATNNKISKYNTRDEARAAKRIWDNGQWQNIWKFRVIKLKG
jgi:hypothetical protein